MYCILEGSPARAGSGSDATSCQDKILAALKSLQDQVAELKSSTATSSTAATVAVPPKEKIAKELSVSSLVVTCYILINEPLVPYQSAIHSTVKHLQDHIENAMEWNTSIRYMHYDHNWWTCITTYISFTDIANRSVTDTIVAACQSEKFPAAVVRSMPCTHLLN